MRKRRDSATEQTSPSSPIKSGEAKGRRLSAVEMSLIAKSLPDWREESLKHGLVLKKSMGAGINLKPRRRTLDLKSLAHPGFETAVADILSRACPEPLLRESNPQRQKLLFRAYFVPMFAASLIGASRALDIKSADWQAPWWLLEHATHVVAFERMFLEATLEKRRCRSNWIPRPLSRAYTAADLPQPSLEWFPTSTVHIRNLEDRFDQWRLFAWKSALLYLAYTACRDIRTAPPARAIGSFMGAIECMTPLPSEVLPTLREHLQGLGPKTVQQFYRAATELNPDKRRKNLALDTWLIEVHPITMRLDWQPNNLLQIAHKVFKKRDDCLAAGDKLRNRMRDLSLNLTERASKVGRPSKDKVTSVHHLDLDESLAAFVRSIGETKAHWMLGSLGLTDTAI